MNIYWMYDLQGIIQRQDMDKTPDNSSPSLVNISNAKPGTWIKDSGSALVDATQAGNGVYGLITFRKNDGTTVL